MKGGNIAKSVEKSLVSTVLRACSPGNGQILRRRYFNHTISSMRFSFLADAMVIETTGALIHSLPSAASALQISEMGPLETDRGS